MTTDDEPHGAAKQPDLAHPDRIFWDGVGLTCVQCSPAWAPTVASRSMTGGLEEGVFYVLMWWAAHTFWRGLRREADDRTKLVISHSARRVPAFFRTVELEFFETETAAQARQVEVLAAWYDGKFENRPALGVRERRRLRVSSRGA